MAICTNCKARKATMFSSFCAICLKDPKTFEAVGSLALRPVVESKPLSEGAMASAVGHAVIWLSIAAAAVFAIVAFKEANGRSVPIFSFVALGLLGAFFGYLLAKVGSVLMHLERNAAASKQS